MSVSIANVTFTGFTGAGFAPTPGSGQLDSDFWRVFGASDGNLDYGGTQAGNDFGRGGVSNASNPSAGGVYAATYGSPSNTGFVIQPSSSDFTSPPGTVTFRVQYTGTQALGSLTFDYDALFRNNEARGTAVSFSYAVQAAATQPDDGAFTTLAPLGYATALAADALGFQTIDLPAQTVSASVAANSYIFLRWTFTENGGSGSRDELGFDNILVTGTVAAVPTVSISPATLSLAEGNAGATAFAFTVTRSSTSGGDVTVPVTLTGGPGFDAADFAAITVGGSTVAGAAIGAPFSVALTGAATSATVIVAIAGDAVVEADETFTLTLADPGAAYDVGAQGSATGTVTNDDTAPTTVTLVDLTFTGFTGAGFAPMPGAGQLDSDVWHIAGFSDGLLPFGGTATSGDLARGALTANPTTGGIYAATYGSANTGFIIQPTGDDYTPGTITYRAQYTGTNLLTALTFDYDALFRNNEARGNSIAFSYALQGSDALPADSAFTTIAGLGYTTPGASDALGLRTIDLPAATVTTDVAPGTWLFLRWTGDDATGSGSRDEIGFDNVLVTGTLGGVAVPTVSIAPVTLTLAEGNAGTTAFAFTVTRSSTSGGDVTVPVTLAGGTGFTAADFASVTVGGNPVAGAAIGTPFEVALTGTTTAVTVTVNIVGDTTTEADETFTLTLADPGAAYDVGAQGSATGTIANDDIAPTAIGTVQGTGRASGFAGQTVTIEGVVTGDFQTADADAGRNLGGFFVQALAADGNPLTSDGIFVFQNDNATLLRDVQVGDMVRVTGTVTEFARFANQRSANLTETQIEVADSASGIQVVTAGAFTQAQVNSLFAVDIDLPSAATLTNAGGLVIADLEQYEGMLVRFPNTFTISEGFNLDRFNEIRAIEGSQAYQFTQNNLPSVAGNQAHVAEVASRTITIDDGLRVQNAPPTLFGTALTTGNTPQIGDSFSGLIGNVRFGDGSSGASADNLSNGTSNTTQTYRILPQNAPTITDTQTRDAAPGRDGGDLKIASANLLNYFVTLGDALTGPPGQQQSARGATNSAEFARQQEKLFTALEQLDADVIVLNEIENNGFGTGSAIRNLVDGLNAALGTPGLWDFVNPDTANGFLGGDAISVGMIYRTDMVQIAQGSSVAVLDDSDIPGLVSAGLLPAGFLAQSTRGAVFNGADTSRAVLVTSFQEIGSGEVFSLAAVHNKSKSGTGTGADADAGDGAGNWNNQRLLANQALDAFLRTNPTGIADPDVLLMGDFNSYARESSIRFLTDTAGWNNLIAERIGADAFSFVFDGFRGYLDYAFATDSIAALVRGVHEWNVNAPEFDAFDYNTDFGRPAGIFDGSTPWRYSDHDPVVVNLLLDPGLLVTRAGATVFVSNSFAEATATALAGDTVVLRDQPRVTDWAAGTIAKGGLIIDLGNVGGAALSLAAGATSVGFLGSAGFALDGSAGGDLIQGNAGANDIEGLGGNDVIAAGGGDDTVDGGEGNDQIEGGAGNDRLFGGSDNDVLTGGEGNDLLDGDAGIDTASYAGAAAAVRVQLNLAGPQQTLGAGMDTLAEIENLIGSAFNDSLVGTTGGNTILGGDGADSIRGLAGADLLEGGAGNDSIRGDAGAQTIAGGDGNDLLFGAAGADRFVFDLDDGADRIADFLRSQGDRIVLTGGTADDLSFAGAQFTFGATSVQLVNAPALIAADFLFA